MPTFVLIHEPGPDWQPGLPYADQPGITEHFAFAQRLMDRGHLLMGGPFLDEGTGGMLVIKAESLEEAQSLAQEDPSVGRVLQVTVRPWRIAMSTVDLQEGETPSS